MSQNVPELTPFSWTTKSEDAARLVAEDIETDEQIAAALEINRRTLTRWKAHPDFSARVQQHIEAFREATLRRGIADRVKRVAALHDRWKRMQRVIAERAEDGTHGDVAGWTTGLLVHTVKGVGRGEDFQLVDLFEVDTGLLRELREHEKQAAQELGQWTEKHDHTTAGKPFQPISIVEAVPPPDLAADDPDR